MANLVSLSRRALASDQLNLCPLSATPALRAVAQRLAGPKVAEHLLEFLKRRGFQRDVVTMWAFLFAKPAASPGARARQA